MITMHAGRGLAETQQRLRTLRQRVGDFPGLHRRAGDALLDWAQRNLAAEGALLEDFPSGWPALSPRTVASRIRRGRGMRMLLDTGRLAAGFTVLPSVNPVTVDNPVPYGRAHQRGAGVPRRPIFPGAPQARRIAIQAATQHVQEALA